MSNVHIPADDPVSFPDGETLPLDTSELHRVFVFRRSDGEHFRLSERAKVVLDMVRTGQSPEEIAAALARRRLAHATPEQVSRFAAGLAARLALAPSPTTLKRHGFSIRFTLLPERVVAPVARTLRPFFSAPAMVYGVLWIVAAVSLWILTAPSRANQTYDESSIIWAYIAFIVTVVVHEFGHAGAAARYGISTGPIGFALYLTFPVLYTDVTRTWMLKRRERVVVSAAGSYLQLLLTTPWIVYDALRPTPTGSALVFMIFGVTVFNLNPVFKFDGYWIVADALGITNIGSAWRRMIHARRARIALPWAPWTVALVCAYALVSALVWAYFLISLIRGVTLQLHEASVTFPTLFASPSKLSVSAVLNTVLILGGIALLFYVLGNRITAAIALVRALAPRRMRN